MKRTNITFDEDTYEYLRKKSYEERKSMAAILRDMIREQIKPPEKEISSTGYSNPSSSPSVSEKKPQKPLEIRSSPLVPKDTIIAVKEDTIFKMCSHGAKVGLCKKGCK